jgi:hypothetical protein
MYESSVMRRAASLYDSSAGIETYRLGFNYKGDAAEVGQASINCVVRSLDEYVCTMVSPAHRGPSCTARTRGIETATALRCHMTCR